MPCLAERTDVPLHRHTAQNLSKWVKTSVLPTQHCYKIMAACTCLCIFLLFKALKYLNRVFRRGISCCKLDMFHCITPSCLYRGTGWDENPRRWGKGDRGWVDRHGKYVWVDLNNNTDVAMRIQHNIEMTESNWNESICCLLLVIWTENCIHYSIYSDSISLKSVNLMNDVILFIQRLHFWHKT